MVSHGVGQVKLVGMDADWFDDFETSMELVLQLLAWSRGVYVAAIEPNHISKLVAGGGGPGLVCMLLVLRLCILHFCLDDVEDVIDAFRSQLGVQFFRGGGW